MRREGPKSSAASFLLRIWWNNKTTLSNFSLGFLQNQKVSFFPLGNFFAINEIGNSF